MPRSVASAMSTGTSPPTNIISGPNVHPPPQIFRPCSHTDNISQGAPRNYKRGLSCEAAAPPADNRRNKRSHRGKFACKSEKNTACQLSVTPVVSVVYHYPSISGRWHRLATLQMSLSRSCKRWTTTPGRHHFARPLCGVLRVPGLRKIVRCPVKRQWITRQRRAQLMCSAYGSVLAEAGRILHSDSKKLVWLSKRWPP